MENDRGAMIQIGNREYEMLLTTRATKEIAKRYGGLEHLGDKLMKAENFELALDEVVWLITLLANQSMLVHNLLEPDDKSELLTEEAVELLTTPLDLSSYKTAIMETMVKGTKRYVESEEEPSKKRIGRASDDELFARLIFYGVTLLGRSEREVWLMPLGALLDQWEAYRQFHGLAEVKREHYIDEILTSSL